MLLTTLIVVALWSGSKCAQWSGGPEDQTILYTCAHGSVSLPWNVLLDHGDAVQDIQWFFSGRSQEIMATEAFGHFFITPAFSGRIRRVQNAGLEMDHVTVMDKGNYSVEVLVRNAGGDVVTLRRSVYVHVADGLQAVDGHLHVSMKSFAEYNNFTEQYHVVLWCGAFSYPTHPPFDVTWTTPSNQSLPSSSFQAGKFLLRLPNPPQGGAYICHVPPSSACLHGNTGDVTYTLNQVEARLSVLEASQADLQSRNKQLEKYVTLLESNDRQLHSEMSRVKDRSSRHVSFSGGLQDTFQGSGRLQGFTQDLFLHGSGFNPATGVFTAPYNGTYFFLGNAGTYSADKYIYMYLMKDGVAISHALARQYSEYNSMGSCNAVVHMFTNQQVWLHSGSNVTYYHSPSTSFTGFLISSDD